MRKVIYGTLMLMAFSEILVGARVVEEFHKTATEKDNVELRCTDIVFDLPEWQGPPDYDVYASQGDQTFNDLVPAVKQGRIQRTDDTQGLVITNVSQQDAGCYSCSYFGPPNKQCIIWLRVNSTDFTEVLDTKNIIDGHRILILSVFVLIITLCFISVLLCLIFERRQFHTFVKKHCPFWVKDQTSGMKMSLNEHSAPLYDVRSTDTQMHAFHQCNC